MQFTRHCKKIVVPNSEKLFPERDGTKRNKIVARYVREVNKKQNDKTYIPTLIGT